jgi:hypothetical protein
LLSTWHYFYYEQLSAAIAENFSVKNDREIEEKESVLYYGDMLFCLGHNLSWRALGLGTMGKIWPDLPWRLQLKH